MQGVAAAVPAPVGHSQWSTVPAHLPCTALTDVSAVGAAEGRRAPVTVADQ